jgi:hypothetical protein
VTGTEVDRESASYAEGMRAGKRVAAKELREAYLNGWRSRRDGIDWTRACEIAGASWPDEEEPKREEVQP